MGRNKEKGRGTGRANGGCKSDMDMRMEESGKEG